jgi:hypothetical protein
MDRATLRYWFKTVPIALAAIVWLPIVLVWDRCSPNKKYRAPLSSDRPRQRPPVTEDDRDWLAIATTVEALAIGLGTIVLIWHFAR